MVVDKPSVTSGEFVEYLRKVNKALEPPGELMFDFPFVLELPGGLSIPMDGAEGKMMVPGRGGGEVVATGVIHMGESLVKDLLEQNKISIEWRKEIFVNEDNDINQDGEETQP